MSSNNYTQHAQVGIGMNVRVGYYDSDEDARSDAAPRSVEWASNVTCIGLHEYLPAILNHRNDYDAVEDRPTAIAFGSDASSFAQGDTALNSRVGSVTLTDPANSGATWSCNELVGELELNGENLRELGIETESGVLWNHAPLPTPLTPKTSDDAIQIAITITFSAP